MRSPQRSGHGTPCALLLALATVAGCHRLPLLGLDGWLIFRAPDNPAALQQLDAGLVAIDFGQVPVGATGTLSITYFSLASTIGLGTVTPLGDAGAFSLAPPPAVARLEASFTPGQAGPQAATFQMAENSVLVPEVTFRFSGEGIGSALAVNPNPVDFGQVPAGHTVSRSFIITNRATVPASLVFSALEGDYPQSFSVPEPGTMPLAPGASRTFSASFLADAGGQDAFFEVSALSDQPPVEVDLLGEGLAGSLIIYPVDFGGAPLGSNSPGLAFVFNSSADKTISLVAPPPSVTPLGSEFALGPGIALPYPIAPGNVALVPVTFSPVVPGEAQATLVVASNDPEASTTAGTLQGVGIEQFECVPPTLDFGPVPIGRMGSLITACTNLTDAPLNIEQDTLDTSNAAFVANLLLPNGRPIGPNSSIALAAGETVGIEVEFGPTDGGEYTATLGISDGGSDTFGTTIALQGSGVVPGPCSLQIVPAGFDFGEVPSGSQGLMQLEVADVGSDICVIDGVWLDPASDPAFALPDGALGYVLLSYPGDPANPTRLPSSLRVRLRYSPTRNQLLATGTIHVTAPNATPTQALVPVSGSSQQACLQVQPSLYDFGTLAFSVENYLCNPAVASFTIRNTCASPVTVTGLAVNSGVDPAPQFGLQSAPKLPLSLAPSAGAEFQASFIPTAAGVAAGAVMLTSNESQVSPYRVSLEGDAEEAVSQVDDFVMPGSSNPVDILWILDADDDSQAETSVAQHVPSLVAAMGQAGIDFRMAVTTTDTCAADRSDRGALEPCDHCLLWGDAGGPEFITTQIPDAGPELVRLFDIPALAALPEFGICARINGDEHFFDSIASALSTDQLAGHNAGFLRDNADLAVVLVNGDAEDDGNGGSGLLGARGTYLTSQAQVTARLRQLKPNSKASVFYVSSGVSVFGAAQKIGKLVQDTGGLEIDTARPAAAWEAQFTGLFQYFEDIGFFRLTQVPLDPAQIAVSVNGIAIDAWAYDPAQNAVVLKAVPKFPAPGSQISVTYPALGCPIRFPL